MQIVLGADSTAVVLPKSRLGLSGKSYYISFPGNFSEMRLRFIITARWQEPEQSYNSPDDQRNTGWELNPQQGLSRYDLQLFVIPYNFDHSTCKWSLKTARSSIVLTCQYELSKGTKPVIVKTTSELSTTVQKLGIRVGEGLQSFCQDGFLQVDRSCAKARRAFAEKFGLGR